MMTYATIILCINHRGIGRIIERGVIFRVCEIFRPCPFWLNHAHIYGHDRDLDLKYVPGSDRFLMCNIWKGMN